MFSLLKKIKEKKIKKLKKSIIDNINQITKKINKKGTVTFFHSGHLGDLINSLPVIKEVSKKKNCKLLININKKIHKKDIDKLHPSGEFYLSLNAYDKIYPLLKKQPFLTNIDIYKGQKIDVNLDLFRDLPINFNIDSIRWYSHVTGVFPNLDKPYLLNIKKKIRYKKSIVFIRTLRRQNKLIKFNFLNKYNNLVFIGLYPEYLDLKKQIPKLLFYDCKNFLEMAEIIASSSLFIGNLSFGYTIAEALKKPRLLESHLDFPLVYPNGKKAFEFYFQNHFEQLVKNIIKR